MKRFFSILLTAMAMLAVALLSAFIAMRVAIHGSEVEVPSLAGLTLAEAAHTAGHLGLSLRLENRFYSTTTASGHILGQSPAPGAVVRHEWPIRITESLGPQQVSIPDVVGQAERPASLALRKASLDVGVIAAIAAPGEAGLVLAQTPPPNAEGVDRPSVSLLLSEPLTSNPQAFVAPGLTGLSLAAASARARELGLRVYVDTPAPLVVPPSSPAYHDSFFPGQTTTAIQPPAPVAPISPSAMVVGQFPQAGHRVTRGEAIRLSLPHLVPGQATQRRSHQTDALRATSVERRPSPSSSDPPAESRALEAAPRSSATEIRRQSGPDAARTLSTTRSHSSGSSEQVE